MIKEFGMDPNIPGLEIVETLIEEDVRHNPNCPCKTRTCPQHGFCKYCIQHHCELAEMMTRMMGDAPHEEPPRKDGEYIVDHGRPVCYRIPTEHYAAQRDDYE